MQPFENVYMIFFVRYGPNRGITLRYSQNSVSATYFADIATLCRDFTFFYMYPNRGVMIVEITK